MPIRHVSLIKFNPDADEDSKRRARDLLQKLGENCGGREAGILDFAAGQSLDTRKADLVVVSLFADRHALESYRANTVHREVTDLLRTIANWWVGDLEVG